MNGKFNENTDKFTDLNPSKAAQSKTVNKTVSKFSMKSRLNSGDLENSLSK